LSAAWVLSTIRFKYLHRELLPLPVGIQMASHKLQMFNFWLLLEFLLITQVNSEICKQTFLWLSKYASITRHMNREHHFFFLLYLCELHNKNLQI
jgi:hypothetical protein